MAENRVRVIEAGTAPARDRDGLFRHRGIWHFKARVNGKWRQFTTSTRNWQQARSKRRAMLGEIEQGKLPGEMGKWPLAKAVEAWRLSRVNTTAPKTQRIERERAVALLRNFPARKLAEITADDIRAYQVLRAKTAAPRTINLETHVLRGVLRMARLWGRLAEDFKALREPAEGPGRALSADEENALFRTAASRPEWHVAYCAAIIAANTSARRCEIAGLRLADVDLFARAMTIRRASTKTDAGARMVPLNDAALWALARLMERARAIGATEPSHYLLPLALQRQTKTGQPCAGTGFDPTRPMRDWRSAWCSLRDKAGLPGLRFHDLRHHAITKLAEAGVPDQTLMAIAGHVSRAMLEHYSHVRAEAKRAAVAAISVGAPAPATADAEPVASVQ